MIQYINEAITQNRSDVWISTLTRIGGCGWWATIIPVSWPPTKEEDELVFNFAVCAGVQETSPRPATRARTGTGVRPCGERAGVDETTLCAGVQVPVQIRWLLAAPNDLPGRGAVAAARRNQAARRFCSFGSVDEDVEQVV
jgi:hypothetical protein